MSKNKTRKENASDVLEDFPKKLHQRTQTIASALEALQPKRGGHRQGAGRPLLGDAPTSERVIFRLTQEQRQLLEEHTMSDESPNQAARRLLLHALRQKK